MTETSTRLDAPPLPQWYRDYVSCLQSTMATLLLAAGEDPVDTLGLGWEFLHIENDVRAEEFYWPCRKPGDVAGSLLPHHAATSRWLRVEADDPLAPLEAALTEGRLPVLAVDNFHLPFRPAYHDVHSAHLIVVSAVDRGAGQVWVSDAMPPAHAGPLSVDDLLRAWTSTNPREQEAFFSGARIEGRWLDVRFDGPFAALTAQRLREAMIANAAGFINPGRSGGGLSGLREFGTRLVAAARAADRRRVEETYTYGWSMQAQSGLHGELLRRCGTNWRDPGLAEAGRRVEQVAHAWTPVRICCAYGRRDPRAWADDIDRSVRRLIHAYHEAISAIDAVNASGQGGGPNE